MTLRQRFAQSFVLLILDSASLVRRAPELASIPAEGLLLRPYQLSDMLDRVATLLAAAGEPRVSWASLRPHVLKAIEYLGARYVETCDVTALASWVGISPSRLAHVFRDAMQGTVRDYINRIRIAAARYLLVHSAGPAADRSTTAPTPHIDAALRGRPPRCAATPPR